VKARSTPQNARLHAICGEVARQHSLIPYCYAFACEVWKRHIIALYIREARLEAYCAGRPDPFPVRPVPSSDLDSQQMSELIESAHAFCASNGIELRK
jgi:hypothetical protein